MELIKNNAKLGAEIAVSLANKSLKSDKIIERPITIVGGASVDIIARSETVGLDSGQSHVGYIHITEGGCARNVAECVARLGLAKDITFISAVGGDAEKSDIIVRSLEKVGIVSIGDSS